MDTCCHVSPGQVYPANWFPRIAVSVSVPIQIILSHGKKNKVMVDLWLLAAQKILALQANGQSVSACGRQPRHAPRREGLIGSHLIGSDETQRLEITSDHSPCGIRCIMSDIVLFELYHCQDQRLSWRWMVGNLESWPRDKNKQVFFVLLVRGQMIEPNKNWRRKE